MFSYFQCESKHGIFAQLHKVKKLNSSSESETPHTPLKPPLSTLPPKKETSNTSKEHVISTTEGARVISDTDSTTKAVEVMFFYFKATLQELGKNNKDTETFNEIYKRKSRKILIQYPPKRL